MNKNTTLSSKDVWYPKVRRVKNYKQLIELKLSKKHISLNQLLGKIIAFEQNVTCYSKNAFRNFLHK